MNMVLVDQYVTWKQTSRIGSSVFNEQATLEWELQLHLIKMIDYEQNALWFSLHQAVSNDVNSSLSASVPFWSHYLPDWGQKGHRKRNYVICALWNIFFLHFLFRILQFEVLQFTNARIFIDDTFLNETGGKKSWQTHVWGWMLNVLFRVKQVNF